MKKGRIVVLDEVNGKPAAALLVNGQIHDLLIEADNNLPKPEAIYRGRTTLPMKGQNGIILDIGNGQKAFLRNAKGIPQGTQMTVQVATHAEIGKATPVVNKLIFKSRYCIVTPDAPGLNIARSIKDDEERDRLLEIVHEVLTNRSTEYGLIIRSSAMDIDADAISDDIKTMYDLADNVMSQTSGDPALIMPAPTAEMKAWRDWVNPDPDEVIKETNSFETMGIWDHIEKLKHSKSKLPNGASMIIEPTSAFVAVDVNTGNDFSLSAGLKANLAVAKELPNQLSLRGLGGQIIIDFAPSPKKDRKLIETALNSSFRKGKIDTVVVGWTTLGNFELQRKRERIPLSELLHD
ncbi:ribonuclease E/G [Amylibacter sp.]|nr:ribonuclease E/G [Amylibacter sp.]MDA9779379.1 ribonuclease E/G [Amylibacter sp.]MDA9910453.1 ribonuclease E/G [Amylibacter sp.]MDB2464194.1 ribonuclease E/G [Amylibacter sp.]MDB4044760.1 ribonuclease E/G [Amylibacter sp.]